MMKKEFFTSKKRKSLFFLSFLIALILWLPKPSCNLAALEKPPKDSPFFIQDSHLKRKIRKIPFSLKHFSFPSKNRPYFLFPSLQIKTLASSYHPHVSLPSSFPIPEDKFFVLSLPKLLFLDIADPNIFYPFLFQKKPTQNLSLLPYLCLFPSKNFKNSLAIKRALFFESLPKLSEVSSLSSFQKSPFSMPQKEKVYFFSPYPFLILQKHITPTSFFLETFPTKLSLHAPLFFLKEKKEFQSTPSFFTFSFSSRSDKKTVLKEKTSPLKSKKEPIKEPLFLKSLGFFAERFDISNQKEDLFPFIFSENKMLLKPPQILFSHKWNSSSPNQNLLEEISLPKITPKSHQNFFTVPIFPKKEISLQKSNPDLFFFEFMIFPHTKAFLNFAFSPSSPLFPSSKSPKETFNFSLSYRFDKQVIFPSAFVLKKRNPLFPILPQKKTSKIAFSKDRGPFSSLSSNVTPDSSQNTCLFSFDDKYLSLQIPLIPFFQKSPFLARKNSYNLEDRKNQIALISPTSHLPSKSDPTISAQKETNIPPAKILKYTFNFFDIIGSNASLLFAFNEEALPLKEDEIENLKQQNLAFKHLTYAEIPLLPRLLENRPIPKKTLPFTKPHFLDIPNFDQFFILAKKQGFFSLTKKFTGKKNLPEVEFQKAPFILSNFPFSDPNFMSLSIKKLIKTHRKTLTSWQKKPVLLSCSLTGHLHAKALHQIHIEDAFAKAPTMYVPHPTELETLSLEQAFETSVTYAPNPQGEGYQFAIEMKPRKNFYHVTPEQNFIFIINRSTTIKKHRYNAFKKAVLRSLAYLQSHDSFNILIADSKITMMNPTPLSFSHQAIQKAKHYLKSQTFRGVFAKYNSFDLLSQIQNHLDPQKENIVILITDGNKLESIKTHKIQLKQLMHQSRGNFALFTACASHGNRLGMLDLISTFNGGEMMYSKTSAAFPRKLAILVKHISNCIAKDIHPFVAKEKNMEISFYPNQIASPAIYADRSYIIYGTTETLENFDLLLQGRIGTQWVNMKQPISFEKATLSNKSCIRGFALQKAYCCYDYYLKKEDAFFLTEAEKLLKPYGIEPATR